MAYRKYKNVKSKVDGYTFDSKKEASRFIELKLMLRAKMISRLVLQPKFPVKVNGQKICTYIADFMYEREGKRIVEDVKGFKTDVYKLKKKLVKATHGIEVVEI